MIIVSSIGGVRASTVIGAYCISRRPTCSSRATSRPSCGPDNIRVNTIAPGLVRTDFAKALLGQPRVSRQAPGDGAPLRRIGEPDDIGGIAVMLAGKAGAFITGQTIIADAGVTIRKLAGCSRHPDRSGATFCAQQTRGPSSHAHGVTVRDEHSSGSRSSSISSTASRARRRAVSERARRRGWPRSIATVGGKGPPGFRSSTILEFAKLHGCYNP